MLRVADSAGAGVSPQLHITTDALHGAASPLHLPPPRPAGHGRQVLLPQAQGRRPVPARGHRGGTRHAGAGTGQLCHARRRLRTHTGNTSSFISTYFVLRLNEHYTVNYLCSINVYQCLRSFNRFKRKLGLN